MALDEVDDDWVVFERCLERYVKEGNTDDLSKGMIGRLRSTAMHITVDDSGSLKHKGRPIPPSEERVSIVERLHLLGHYGIDSTMTRILKEYWWPGMYQMVKKCLMNCKECCAYDDAIGGKMVRTVKQHVVSRGVFKVVGTDYMGPLPKTRRGNQYLLMFNCQLSDFAEWVATPTNDALITATKYIELVIARYGPPTHLLSDRGGEFVNTIISAINDVTGTIRKVTSGYHPQTNGKVEKHNHILMQLLRKLCAESPEDWDLWVPYVLLADRSRVRRESNYSPMYLVHGHDSVLFNDFRMLPEYHGNEQRELEDRVEHINRLIEIIHPQLELKSIARAREARRMLEEVPAIEPGTYVQIKRKDFPKIPKLLPRYLGLYRVIERLTGGNYKLERIRGRAQPMPVHPNRIRPIGKDLAMRLLTDKGMRDDQLNDDDEDVYEIEKILSHRVTRRGLFYEIKWKGYDEVTIEPEANLVSADEVVREYWNRIHEDTDTRGVNGKAAEQLHLVAPHNVVEECLVALRPMPAPQLQEWIKENVGIMDVDLLPFNTPMSFCKRNFQDVRACEEIEDVWANIPFGKWETAIEWMTNAVKCKKIFLLVPEWMDEQNLGGSLRVQQKWELPIGIQPWFCWPNRNEYRVVGYQCRVVRCYMN
jgi:hypothetical protein